MVDSDVADLPDRESVRGQLGSVPLFEDHAAHADQRFEMASLLCRQALQNQPELNYLGYYVNGIYGFAFGSLDETAPQPDRSASSNESRHNDYKRIGVQLTNAVIDLDNTLLEVRTGALIRTVLHAPGGVICCNSIVPKEYVVGFTFATSARPTPGVALPELTGAKKVDIAISKLATALRRELGLPTLNPGASEDSTLPVPDGDVAGNSRQPRLATAHDVPPHIEGSAADVVADLFRAEVTPDELHYVAHCRDGEVTFVVDQFDHPRLGLFFTQISPQERRSFYHHFCRQFSVIIGQLGRMVGSAIDGRLERVVLDVEQGGIYYYRIHPGEYLVGITINQLQVSNADNRMARLALCYRKLSHPAR